MTNPRRFFRITHKFSTHWGECWMPEDEFVRYLAQDEHGQFHFNWGLQEVRLGHMREFTSLRNGEGRPSLPLAPNDVCIRVVEYAPGVDCPMKERVSQKLPMFVDDGEKRRGQVLIEGASEAQRKNLRKFELQGQGTECIYQYPNDDIDLVHESSHQSMTVQPALFTIELGSSGEIIGERTGWRGGTAELDQSCPSLNRIKESHSEEVAHSSQAFQEDTGFHRQFDLNEALTGGRRVNFGENMAVQNFQSGVVYIGDDNGRTYGVPSSVLKEYLAQPDEPGRKAPKLEITP